MHRIIHRLIIYLYVLTYYNLGSTKEVTMEYRRSIIAEIEQDCNKVRIVMDAIELLADGFPLDEDTITELGTIGVDYAEFIRQFEIPE